MNGIINSSDGETLLGCNIKVSSLNSALVLAYTNSGNSNYFTLQLNAKEDSLSITVSCTHYESNTVVIPVKAINKVEFVLSRKAEMLDEVIVKAPAIWKRGDTTFYKVDEFKEGDEKKLIDILKRLPDFRVMDDGTLLYKNVAVDRLMIDGEEIFADKIVMLLKTIPSHILNTIQAVENQTDNKLLKGLSHNGKVFLNLGLKKDVVATVFGDAELGVSSNGKYLAKPVIFSLYGKLKLGLISNWNSIGETISQWDLYQVKTKAMNAGETGMMNLNNLQRIQNMPDNKFLTNNLKDTRLQVNFLNSKKVSSQLELVSLQDQLEQESYRLGYLLSNGNYISEKRSSHSKYSPRFHSLRSRTQFSIDSSSQLVAEIIYELNRSRSNSFTSIAQDSSLYKNDNSISNKYNGVGYKLDYTKRISAATALRLLLEYSNHNLDQSANGYSLDWYRLFNLPDEGYDNLSQGLFNNTKNFNTAIELIKRINRSLWSFNFQFSSETSDRIAPLSFNKSISKDSVLLKPELSGEESITIRELVGSTTKSFNILKAPIQLKVNFGIAEVKRNDSQNQKFSTPVYNVEINHRKELKKLYLSAGLIFNQKLRGLYQLGSEIFPSGIGTFNTYNTAVSSLRSVSGFIGMGLKLPNYSRLNFSLNNTKYLNGYVLNAANSGFVSYYEFGISERNTDNYYLDARYEFPWLDLETKVSIGSFASLIERLVNLEGLLNKLDIYQYSFYVEGKRNWNKKLYLTAKSSMNRSFTKLPSKIKESGESKSYDITNSINLRSIINERFEVLGTLEHYHNTSANSVKYDGLFSNLKATYNIPEKRLSCSLGMDNIFNEKQYSQTYRFSEVLQTTYSLPLNPRRVILSVRYEF